MLGGLGWLVWLGGLSGPFRLSAPVLGLRPTTAKS